MKLALLFLVGFACVLHQAYSLPVEQFSDDQSELERDVRRRFEEVLEKVKDAIEKGKAIREDVLDKLKDIRETMKEKSIDMSNKAKELLEKIKSKAKDYLKTLLERLGLKEKEQQSVARLDINLKEAFKKLKQALLDTIDKDKLKEKIESFFGKGNEMADRLLELVREHGGKGKQKILDMIDRFLGDAEAVQKRSIKEMWEKVKDYFKELQIDIKEKYFKFGEWVKEKVSGHLEKGKSKLDNIKEIAKEFVKQTKDMSKDIAAEALDFLRPYHEDLGALWQQVKDSAKEVFNRND